MKHKGLLITGICLLSVLALALVGVLIWGLTGSSAPLRFGTRVSEKVIYNESFRDISDIVISSDFGDISFEENSDGVFVVTAYGESEKDVTVLCSDGKLNIQYPQKSALNWIRTQNIKNNIVVSLPSDYDKTIKVESDCGDVEMCALPKAEITVRCAYGNVRIAEAESAFVTNDCGNIKIGSVAEAEAEDDYGKIEIESITRRCDIRNNCGDIVIGTLSITEDSTIRDELGKIKVDGAPNVRVEASTDLGKVNVRANSDQASVKLKIENSCGDITVG